MNVVIVESNPVSADVLTRVAQQRGHQVVCFGGSERLASNLPFEPSVVILSTQGLDAAARHAIAMIRGALSHVVLIVVAERLASSDLSLAVRAGANDVASSPYNPHELVLRAEMWDAALHTEPGQRTSLTIADLDVDLAKYLAVKNGQTILLTKLELRLLYCLMEHHPHLAPLDRLLNFGWDILSNPDASLIKTHMSHLRKKLGEAGGVPFDIQSRQTVGYILSVGPAFEGPGAADARALEGVV